MPILALALWFVPVLSIRTISSTEAVAKVSVVEDSVGKSTEDAFREIDQWTWDAFVEIKRLRAQSHTCDHGGVSTFFPAIENDTIKFDCKLFHTGGDEEDPDQDPDTSQSEVYTYCRTCDGATAANKWLQSTIGHCNAILNPTATTIGIAHYNSPNIRFEDYGAAILSNRELESDTMCHCRWSKEGACQN